MKIKPDVLVLAFDSLDKAQRHDLGLYRLGTTVRQHPHRRVVLRRKEDVQQRLSSSHSRATG